MLIQPLITSSSAEMVRGTDSPVRADVSTLEFPSSIIPSIGILSPGFTMIVVPISTSSGSTETISPSFQCWRNPVLCP